MGNNSGQPTHLQTLIAHFTAFGSLSDAELSVLSTLADTSRYHPPYRDLSKPDALPILPRMVVAGWACQYCTLADGQRQIITFKLPGDLLWPRLRVRLPLPCAVTALTELETVSAQPFADAADAAHPIHAGLGHATRVMAELHDVLVYNHVVRLGRQTARARFIHLMLELHERLARVGLAEPGGFAMPLTQDVLADVLGFSTVHVNRTVQQLRHDGLLDVRNGTVHLLQPERLQVLASWTPTPRFPIQ